MNRRMINHRLFWVVLLLTMGCWVLAQETETGRKGYLLEVEGVIGPSVSDYISRALDKAEEEKAVVVILRMDTPGGLDSSMRDIIKRIIASRVPVVTYVAPGGARAASAGTYILYASHVAAMAPGTNLGAATPVTIGGVPSTPDPTKDKEKPADNQGTDDTAPPAGKTDPKQSKLINDAAAYLQSLAKMHGRNAEWAEKAVREAASLPAEEALELKVIDLIAADLDALKQQLQGREIKMSYGPLTLDLANMILEPLKPDWRSELLAIISNPNVAYILMLVGIYGIIYEFANPGAIVPGTVGAVSLLLALYAFNVLPVNYAGVALIILGVALMVAEAFMPSFGALGVGGMVSFVFGSLILIDTDQPGYGISLTRIGALSLSSAFLLMFVLGFAMRSHQRPVVSGKEEML
ncbi:MAG: nodulation protein NfeD, partial [Chromatiales bacterium]|nr:nodulation protein NfeD [Chromatiales bacterium]